MLETHFSVQERQQLIKNLKIGTKEWCSREINISKGCENDCIYCYARNMAYRMHRIQDYPEWEIMTDYAKINVPILRKKTGIWDFMFQSASDICESNLPRALTIMEKIVQTNQTILITSKPRLKVIENICDRLKDYKHLLAFRFTIGSVDSSLLRRFERKASSFEERIRALEFAYSHDFRTTISAEPLIDKDPSKLIDKLMPFLSSLDRQLDVGTIWIGFMKTKYIPKKYVLQYDLVEPIKQIQIQQSFSNVIKWYEKFYDNPRIRMKESVKRLMLKHNIQVLSD